MLLLLVQLLELRRDRRHGWSSTRLEAAAREASVLRLELAGELLRHARRLGLKAGVASVLRLQGRLTKASRLRRERTRLLLLLLRLTKRRSGAILRLLLLLAGTKAGAAAEEGVGVRIHGGFGQLDRGARLARIARGRADERIP